MQKSRTSISQKPSPAVQEIKFEVKQEVVTDSPIQNKANQAFKQIAKCLADGFSTSEKCGKPFDASYLKKSVEKLMDIFQEPISWGVKIVAKPSTLEKKLTVMATDYAVATHAI